MLKNADLNFSIVCCSLDGDGENFLVKTFLVIGHIFMVDLKLAEV